jgi:F-type H+-transporting ATPase subunit a
MNGSLPVFPRIPTVLAADNPVDHVVNHPFFKVGEYWVWSAHVGNLVLSAVIILILIPWFASRVATGPENLGASRYITRGRFAQFCEVIYLYIRDEVVKPVLGDRTQAFLPYLMTLFVFILVNNLLGLVPILDLVMLVNKDWAANHVSPVGGTATQNLYVTAALALIAFLVINIAGIRALGLGGYLKHLTCDTPPFMWPIIVPVEIIGTFIKPIALAMRLFANMTAGHILMATLFAFVGMAAKASLLVFLPVTLLAGAGAVAFYFLELFVAFLQAFIFMFLTTVFIGQLSHHHEHEHDDAHGHEHAAHGHAHAH